MQRPLRIGTRGSPLALYQARLVQTLLAQRFAVQDLDKYLPICVYTTSGDKLKGALAEFGGKGLFTKELEMALENGEIDLAVHSMKDVPTQLQNGHVIAAILEREDPRDAFISVNYQSIEALPIKARIGTASLRRRAQLAALRPDIEFTLIRGNVGTRLKKLQAGDCDGTFLAYAGLKRLDKAEHASSVIDLNVMLCAPAQAAIGIEIIGDDDFVQSKLVTLNHEPTQIAVSAERAFLKALDGSCRTPIAALCEIRDGKLFMRGEQLSDDGQKRWAREGFMHHASVENARKLGTILGRSIQEEIKA